MELVNTMEINGEEREIADAYARGQCAANAEGIAELNSNLNGLGYGENGAYNLLDLSKLLTRGFSIEEGNITNITTDTRASFYFFIRLIKKDGSLKYVVSETILQNESKDFTFSIPSGYEEMSMNHNGISKDIYIADFNISDFGLKENDTITVHISVSSADPTVVGGIVINELAIVKGSTFTEYKPYIPSVKMLAEEVSAQNESLDDYGLVNKANGWLQRDSSRIVTPKTSCTEGKTIRFIADYDINYFGGKVVLFYNSSGTQVGNSFSIAKQDSTFTVPSGATSFEVLMYKDTGVSASGNYPYSLYVDNAIDELKSDLTAYADGTKAVAKATTADSATKATQDGNGNIIADTYLRKTDSTNVLLPIGSMIMCNAEQISQYYGTWVDLGTTTITCTTGTGEDIMDVTYNTHVFNRTA